VIDLRKGSDSKQFALAHLMLGLSSENRRESMALIKLALPLFQAPEDAYYIGSAFLRLAEDCVILNEPERALVYLIQSTPFLTHPELKKQVLGVILMGVKLVSMFDEKLKATPKPRRGVRSPYMA
jgi:hypothetical protein